MTRYTIAIGRFGQIRGTGRLDEPSEVQGTTIGTFRVLAWCCQSSSIQATRSERSLNRLFLYRFRSALCVKSS